MIILKILYYILWVMGVGQQWRPFFPLCISCSFPKGNGQAENIQGLLWPQNKITKWVKLTFCSFASSISFPLFVFFFLLSHQMHLCFITITFEQSSTFPQLNFHPVGQQHILSSLYLVVEGLWNPCPACLASHVVDKELWRTHFCLLRWTSFCKLYKDKT